jgi:glycosyltransferase involved in cell wall biosynthesis
VGAFDLPNNVTVVPLRSTEGVSAKRAGLALAAELGRRSWTREIDLVFAHMVPTYALIAAVFAKPVRIPICLWYASHGLTKRLRIAHRVVDSVATASTDSYPLNGRKVVVLGHGIDASRYTAADGGKADPPVILAASRITAMKQIHLAVEALGHARLWDRPDGPVLEVAGEPFRDDDREYLRSLRRRVGELGLTDRVRFLGAVPGDEMPNTLARAQLAVSLRGAPALDKNGLEALLAGVPVVSNNPSYRSVVGSFADDLYVEGDDPGMLAAKLARLLDDAELRSRIAASLRDSVEADHGLSGFADRLVGLFEAVCRGVPPRSTQASTGG